MGTYLVTGASSGLGWALYVNLEREHTVLTTSRRNLERRDHFVADLRNEDERLFLSEWVRANYPPLDGLINNAGFLTLEKYEEVSLASLKDTFEVNFFAPFHLTQLLIDYLVEGAHILNVASVSGMHGDPDSPHYGAAKAAMIQWTKSLAVAYPQFRVNSISPGLFETNLVPGEVPQELLDSIPLGRSGHPFDFSNLTLAILKSKYMTGSNVVIDGGVTAK